MKIRHVAKLVLVFLVVGVGLGVFLSRRASRSTGNASSRDQYADTQPDFDPAGAVPGELAVDFADDVSDETVASVGKQLGIRFRPAGADTARDRLYIGEVDPTREAADLAVLRHDPRVEAAEEDLIFGVPESAPTSLIKPSEEGIPDDANVKRGPSFPNDPRYGEQWHLDQIHMPATWSAATGEGVIVAVIDTGVSRVEDLAQTEFVPGWNFVNNTANAEDDHGHGTHVAGTIAQSTHNGIGVAGVAFKARIMPLKVLSAGGSGTVAGIARAVRFAADNGAKVINMSLGGAMNSQVLAKAVKYAHDKGVVVVCAAGNDGRGKVSYPAANDGAVAVAATQQDERTTFYSNWGKQVAIAGPGGNTREAPTGGVLQNTRFQGKDDYYFFMGTSMASPHIAGVAALIESQGVTDPDAVLKVMQETARQPRGLSEKPGDYAAHYGAGIVDAAAAVKKAQLGRGELSLGLSGGLALVLAFMLRRSKMFFGVGGFVGLIVGASGLFLLPRLGLANGGALATMARGFPAWDELLLGATGHGNTLFYSAALPVVLVALLYGVTRLRGALAGFALGVGGHLLGQALVHDVDIRFIPLDSAWLVGNALVLLVIAALVAAPGRIAARR